MSWSVTDSLKATLLYAGIFEYPLTKEEIYRWLIVPYRQKMNPQIDPLLKNIPKFHDMYSLDKVHSRYLMREKKELYSKTKRKLLHTYSRVFTWIPTLDLVGISGGVSMNNAEKDDDIDLFFICHPQTIWSTRLAILFMLSLIGKRRKYGNNQEKDMICPNMFMVKDRMRLPVSERHIYSAHEVLQMEPLLIRENTYIDFLHENYWSATLLPNAWTWRLQQSQQMKSIKRSLFSSVCVLFFQMVNSFCKWIQLISINRHKTSETISDSVLRFHPQDAHPYVIKRWRHSLAKHHIPLDRHFF